MNIINHIFCLALTIFLPFNCYARYVEDMHDQDNGGLFAIFLIIAVGYIYGEAQKGKAVKACIIVSALAVAAYMFQIVLVALGIIVIIAVISYFWKMAVD